MWERMHELGTELRDSVGLANGTARVANKASPRTIAATVWLLRRDARSTAGYWDKADWLTVVVR